MLYPVLKDMNNWLDNDFDDMLNTCWMPRMNVTAPAINVKENDKEYEVELAAPGTTKDDFKVNVDKDGNLTIKMEHKDEKKDENKPGNKNGNATHYLRREFSYSNYEQLRRTRLRQRLITVCFISHFLALRRLRRRQNALRSHNPGAAAQWYYRDCSLHGDQSLFCFYNIISYMPAFSGGRLLE